LAVIYRPDSASALTINDVFFAEFADLLERTSTFARYVIAGDVNIHLDDANGVHTARFFGLLHDFGLQEIVRQPTHCHGHQLDVFITFTVTVDPQLMFDHSLITAAIKTRRRSRRRKTVRWSGVGSCASSTTRFHQQAQVVTPGD